MTRSGDLSEHPAAGDTAESVGDTAGLRTQDVAKTLRGLQRASRPTTDQDVGPSDVAAPDIPGPDSAVRDREAGDPTATSSGKDANA